MFAMFAEPWPRATYARRRARGRMRQMFANISREQSEQARRVTKRGRVPVRTLLVLALLVIIVILIGLHPEGASEIVHRITQAHGSHK